MITKISFQKISAGLVSLVLVAVLASGCATSYGNKIDAAKISQIKKSVTTRDELVALLGHPCPLPV